MDWLECYVENTIHTGSPERFRLWSGLSTLSAAMQRRVWTETRRGKVYPNIYCLLVSPPGIGKTEMVSFSYKLLNQLEHVHLAPISITKAGIADQLAKANVNFNDLAFNALALFINELSNFMPSYDTAMLGILTDLFDCKVYTEYKRTNSVNIVINNPQLHLLAGTTPEYLSSHIPDSSWQGGFISRTFLVHSDEETQTELFGANPKHKERLLTELQARSELYGNLPWETDAQIFLQNWYEEKGPPRPTHPRLESYCTRRPLHLIKLGMLKAISNNHRIIEEADIKEALDILIEMEDNIEDIFRKSTRGSSAELIEDCWHFIQQCGGKNGKAAVPKGRVINFLAQRAHTWEVKSILEAMEHGGWVRKVHSNHGAAYEARSNPNLSSTKEGNKPDG